MKSAARPASGLFAPLLPAIAPKSFRAALGDEIERMIALLDAIDGDADLEEGGDLEPSLGAYRVGCDLELDASDDEPSLGSLGGTAHGLWFPRSPVWAGGGRTDAELDNCDLEDTFDREDDPAELGIGDQDGLEEQTGRFDRSGEEPERFHRPYNPDAVCAKRRMRADVERQVWTIAARVNGAAPSNVRVVRL